MFGSSLKKTIFAGALAAGLTLTGCFFEQGPSQDGQKSVVGVRVAVPKGYSDLAKASTITLSKMYITLISDVTVPDTIRDTITPSTIPALQTSTASNQTVAKYYTVKPLRKWKLLATTIDANNQVIHDSATGFSPTLYIGDTATLNLSMNAKFEMYRANFNNLPDSLSSSTAGTVKQKVWFHRLTMNIDGTNRADSSKSWFSGSPQLAYDYVPVGTHTVVLTAYGRLDTTKADVLLYNDTASITVGPGVDTTITRPLVYRGPGAGGVNGGTGAVSVTIGKVGIVVINASENGTISGL